MGAFTLLSLGTGPPPVWVFLFLQTHFPTGFAVTVQTAVGGYKNSRAFLGLPSVPWVCSMGFFRVRMGSCFSPLSSGVCSLCSIPSFISLIFTRILCSAHFRMSPSVALCWCLWSTLSMHKESHAGFCISVCLSVCLLISSYSAHSCSKFSFPSMGRMPYLG